MRYPVDGLRREFAGRAASAGLWCALALGAAACSQPPAPLGVGECRTDVDCTGDRTCLIDGRDPIGTCGCADDGDCPSLLSCGSDGRCGCLVDAHCPASLVCTEDGACVCEDDGMCQGVACEGSAGCPGDTVCRDGWCRPPSADSTPWPACACRAGACVQIERAASRIDPARSSTCDVEARSARNLCGGRQPLLATAEDGAAAPATPGEVCGFGEWGVWACAGCDGLRCCRAGTVEILGPGRCAEAREGEGGEDDAATCCPTDEFLDPCGGCVALDPGDPRLEAALGAGCTLPEGAEVGERILDEETPGVWRCEDDDAGRPRLACAVCLDADDRNPCGGCGDLRVVPDEWTIASQGLAPGEACGPGTAHPDFDIDCPGELTCLDARTIACAVSGPARCGDPGDDPLCAPFAVRLAPDVELDDVATHADERYCVLDASGDDPRACRTLGDLSEVRTDADLEGLDPSFDVVRETLPCGECGSGEWTCEAWPDASEPGDASSVRTRLVCAGADDDSRNACGVCGAPVRLPAEVEVIEPEREMPMGPAQRCLEELDDLPPPPGDGSLLGLPCLLTAPDGEVQCGLISCDSAGLRWACVTRASNACGGVGPLEPAGAVPGQPCGPRPECGWTQTCHLDDPNRVVCDDGEVPGIREARPNDCDGCQPLLGTVDDPRRCPNGRRACLADGTEQVCIYEDGDFPGIRSDRDGRCHCARIVGGNVELIPGVCLYRYEDEDNIHRCDDDDQRSRACGATGQACCPTGPACNADDARCRYDEAAYDERCLPCGGLDEVCCADSTCEPGGECTCLAGECDPAEAGLCRPCGVADAPCCRQGRACGANTVCLPRGDEAVCVSCGDLDGAPCCDAGAPCDAVGLICVEAACRDACGARGEPCCEGACGAGLQCQGGRCEPPPPCGGEGETCCFDPSPCGGEQLACVPGAPPRCQPCGAVGQPCCDGDLCDAPAQCEGRINAVCGCPRPEDCDLPEVDAGLDAEVDAELDAEVAQ